jgi:hypothetical protein
MQTLFAEEKKRGLLSSGWMMVMRNKRYIGWFWLLNLTLAEFGTGAFRRSAHSILDHSLYSDRLLHGFDAAVFGELLARPEFGSMQAAAMPAAYFSFVFLLATAVFLPGVFAGYASTYRLPREDFFRACGRNLWRYIRLMIIAGIVMGIVAGVLFAINGAIGKKAVESTNELLPFELNMVGLAIIFLAMTILRIWFDLAEADVVLNDQKAVRKSIARAFGHAFSSLGRLLGSYVLATILAAIFLVGGLWCWLHYVPSTSIIGAFVAAQISLILTLIPRFWQRGVAVAYWKQKMMVPVAQVDTTIAAPVLPTAVPEPAPQTPPSTAASSAAPPIPGALPETQGT